MSSVRIKAVPLFKPLFNEDCRYLYLLGGSGSGKSVFASQKVVIRTVSEKKSRILCVRKVAATIRESVFKELHSRISEMQLMNEFRINKSEMKFTHLPTGNEILTGGLDDVEKLKSISGITSIWGEEMTEFNEEDYDQLDIRLRGKTVSYKQIIGTFNPIDENHWLKKRTEDEPLEGTKLIKSTFKDNPFLDIEYKQVLEQKAKVNPNFYRIYYLGEWGKAEIQSPYLQNFDISLHTANVTYNNRYPLIFSFDFNVDPFACDIYQIYRDDKGHHVYGVDEITLFNGDVFKMADTIRSKYSEFDLSRALYTGDAMQRKREITQKNNIDAWRILTKELRISKNRLKVPTSNPKVSENRHLCNYILSQHPDLKLNASKCPSLVNDCLYVECDEEGNIMKKNRNKEAQRADHLDNFRYLLNTFMIDFIDKPNKYK